MLRTAIVVALCFAAPAAAATHTADIVVYGGTSAGVAAAVQAARMGKSVVLVSPERRIGGMTVNGLGATDSGDKRVIGGIALEFYKRLKTHYDDPAAWKLVRREDYADWRPGAPAIWRFEPHVAQELFETMLREAKVQVLRQQRLVRDHQRGVSKDGQRITAMRLEPSGDQCRGHVYIDATYEGDLMAEAGVSYHVGRESNDAYGETLNGVQPALNVKNHRFEVPVDPYVTPGNPESGLCWGVHDEPLAATGEGDHRIQAYCFRMCMSNVPENSTPFAKPADYDEARYELLLRNFEAGDLRVPFHPLMMPNGKTDTNNLGAFSTDNIGMNYGYPEASYADRERIEREHLSYQQGLMWTLANHPRVPAKVREHMQQWGLARDEFTDNGNWPTEMYVREARRMMGQYVVTEHDVRSRRVAEDSVGMGSYNMDSHNCQRYVDPSGHAQNEGDVQESPGGPYVISYRALVPKRGEVHNLIVPVCLSASHIAYGSIRMEPVFMILGQSAATAAGQAIDANASVQDVDYAKLRERLLADGQVLQRPGK
ncbi:MAG: FAD-dependent oxidoreductase [Planctomycetota bacterium]|nr:MAG: FAD-dependent oxidoreductase [Planctomycetota bacterium]